MKKASKHASSASLAINEPLVSSLATKGNFRDCLSVECFWKPEWIVPSAWTEHAPFAFWLVGATAPRTFTELGTYSGYSYLCFCQAVQQLGIATKCYGIDTWKGDGEEIYLKLREYHDAHYSEFSQLIRSTFDEAAAYFPAHAIDLLHIDGRHFYKDVKNDFETWAPKLSNRAIVLFHDINVREQGFGVWQLWEELQTQFPSFEFYHGHGLGVLGFGSELPHSLQPLFFSSPENQHNVRLAYARLGSSITDSQERRAKAAEMRAELPTHELAERRLQSELADLRNSLAETERSLSTALIERDQVEHQILHEREATERLRLQLAQQSEENRILRNTYSLRLTAPLRIARRELRRIVKDARSVFFVAQRRITQWFSITSRRSTAQLQETRTAGNLPSKLVDYEDIGRVFLKVSRATPVASATFALHPSPNNRKLICLSHVAPWPPRAGNEYRIHRMLSWAARAGWDAFLLVSPLPGQEPDAEQIQTLCSIYPNVVVICRDGRVVYSLNRGGDALDALNGQLTPAYADVLDEPQPNDPIESWTLDYQRIMANNALIMVLMALADAIRPAVVLANYVFMSRALPLLPQGIIKVLDTHDVFSTKDKTVQRFGIADNSYISPELEGRLLARADVIIAIQSEERAILSTLAPGKTVLTAGVDFDFTPLDSPPAGRSILLVASGNPLNVKGAHDFLRFAWPLVQRKFGDAELLIVGLIGESIKVRDPNVRVLGRVDDLAPLYAQARVVINPAVAGTGLKIKTIEAIANLRPIVLWPSGVSGIDPELKAYCYIAENWYSFAKGVIEHLDDERAIAKLRQNQDRVRKLIAAENVYSDLAKVLGQPC
ncbi:MAG: class I SAM-dependent methyltransferase [Bryobacteraceae bacterium]